MNKFLTITLSVLTITVLVFTAHKIKLHFIANNNTNVDLILSNYAIRSQVALVINGLIDEVKENINDNNVFSYNLNINDHEKVKVLENLFKESVIKVTLHKDINFNYYISIITHKNTRVIYLTSDEIDIDFINKNFYPYDLPRNNFDNFFTYKVARD